MSEPIKKRNPIFATPQAFDRLKRAVVFGLFATFVSVVGAAAAEAATLKVYWSGIEDNFIRRVNIDGTGEEKVVESAGGAWPDMAFDPLERKMYWSSPVVSGIQRANYDGSSVETVIHDIMTPTDVVIDSVNRKAYWVDFGPRTNTNIWRSNLDGTSRELLASGLTITAVEVDPQNGFYYWSDRVTGTIHRTSIADNSQTAVIFDEREFGQPTLIEGLAIDPVNGYVYAADYAYHAILRVGVDGSEPSRWLTEGVYFPHAVAVDPVNERLIWSNENLPGPASQWSSIASVNFQGADQRIDFVPMFNPYIAGHPRHLAIVDIAVPEPRTMLASAIGLAFGASVLKPRRVRVPSRCRAWRSVDALE
jgi:DNA-binding beta-propeller fold protein YncE